MQKKTSLMRCRHFSLMLILVLFLWAHHSAAQTPSVEPSLLADADRISLWSTVTAGGPIGYLIMFMSLVAVSFIIEHFITIRRDRLIPTQLIYDLDQLLQTQQYEQARCRRRSDPDRIHVWLF
jgi:biopolymer transport protein ExbB